MLPSRSVPLTNFTADEREDFFRVLKIMKIEYTLQITFSVETNHKADHEAMLLLLSEFNRGRIAKT